MTDDDIPHDYSGAPSLVPGALVRHPTEKDWGLGQIQSVIGDRVTVNFEHRGKVMINSRHIALIAADPEPNS
jgi:hypothetical protein